MNFIFDLDGTICFDAHTIDTAIVEVLLRAEDLGHKIIFATARSYRDTINVLGKELSQEFVIGLNGGVVYDKGQLILEQHLPRKTVLFINQWCKENNIPYFMDNHFHYCSHNPERIPFIASVDPLNLSQNIPFEELELPIKCVVNFDRSSHLLEDMLSNLTHLPKVDSVFHENEACLYINPYGSTKSETVKKLLIGDYIAFGNDKNDIGLFQNAKYSIQIGNYEQLVPYASEVLLDIEKIPDKIMSLFKLFS